MSLLNIGLLVKEFYAIEAISAMTNGTQYSHFEPMRPSHRQWCQDFSDFRNEFITKLAYVIYDYTVLVVAAELRHCRRKASHYINGYYSGTMHRNEVFKACKVFNPGDLLMAGVKMFDTRQVGWEDGYGGEKWKQIAKAGLMKGTVSDCIYIDHCVDLSHNNSIYFDKSAGIFCFRDKDSYESFLDLKRYCEPPYLIREKKGYYLNRFLWRASNLSIVERLDGDGLFSPLYDATESSLLCYQPIQWGDKRVDCSERNVLKRIEFYKSDYERRREHSQCAA